VQGAGNADMSQVQESKEKNCKLDGQGAVGEKGD